MSDTKELAVISEDKILEWLNLTNTGSELTDKEKKQFIEVAAGCNLNPFKREVYCVAYDTKQGRKLSIITGYEVYIKRATRSGLLNGWKVDVEGTRKEGNLKAIVTIFRKDWETPFVHEAYWFEYVQNNKFWKEKPVTMIKKVAIAQAFRLCFPDELDGIPYTGDEVSDDMSERIVSPEPEDTPEDTPEAPPKVSPAEQVFGPIKELESHVKPKKEKSIDKEAEEYRDKMITFVARHPKIFSDETLRFLNDIDLLALKKDNPIEYLDSQMKRLEEKVEEDSPQEEELLIF